MARTRLSLAPARTIAAAAAATLVATLLTVSLSSSPQASAAVDPAYRATITRTAHGIPHIVAADFGSLGFGSGYATAETMTCTLADILVTARGERSRYLGPTGRYDDQTSMKGTNLQVDALVTDLHERRVVERLLADAKAGPGAQARQMVAGYAAGVNKYLASIGGAENIADPTCRGAAYIKGDVTSLDIWYGVYLANILASTGHFVPQIVGATPPTLTDLGLPDAAQFAPVPAELPSAEELSKALGKDPASPFGSNATAIGRDASSTGRGMVLGNPHFPWNGRYRFTQQHLTIPGQYDVAGASLIGSPVVNIGWNNDVAWSHTVSTAYRFAPYEYRTLVSPLHYLSANGLIRKVERRVVEVEALQPDGSVATVTEDLYRTPQGYVIDDPSTLMGWTPSSFFAIRDANAEQLRTIDTFLEMGRATSVRDLLAKQDAAAGMPWVNTTAADRSGEVVYADHSVVPNISDSLAATCMTPIGRVTYQLAGLPGLDGTLADSLCRWGTDADSPRPGVFGPSKLPAAFRTDWVMNANDSYWLPNPAERLEGYARIIGCEKCQRTLRSKMVYQYVLDRLAIGTVTPEALRGFQHENRVRGAEVMSENDDLVTVCRAAEGGDACEVLASWDRMSNIDSVGNHIFEEFVKRLPSGGLLPAPRVWTVPFSADDPLNTPRDLDEGSSAVITAMRDAIAALRARGVPMDASWGSLQVSADHGAPAIPLGGGLGDLAGNANALASKSPTENRDFLRPITFGSSHIQAVSFLDSGVDARTILTYGQSDNPGSPWSADQTVLFGQKQWVQFPWTTSQIASQRLSKVTITS